MADHFDQLVRDVAKLKAIGEVSARSHVVAIKRSEQGAWNIVSVHTRNCCSTALRVANKKGATGYIGHVDVQGRLCCWLAR